MAAGTRRVVFKVQVRVATSGADFSGDLLIEIDYLDDNGLPRYTSLNSAVSSALAFVRRYQSAGVDAEAGVIGKVIGADATTPLRAMTGGEVAEKLYAHLDTVAHGLKQRISLANRETTLGGAPLDADTDPDIGVFTP